MIQSPERAAAESRRQSWLLAFFAHATLVYPLIVLGLFYGEWFLAWHALGHKPSPWGDDDPNFISGSSWMHPITALALLGIMPVGCIAIVVNVAYVVRNRLSACQVAIRLQTLVGLWLGMIASLWWEPWGVGTWWFD